jgi:hypothetical protein
MTKIVLSFLLAVGVAAAADTWRVNIPSPTWVGTTELKPGDYKVALEGSKATFKMGKEVIEVPAKMEEGINKNSQTALGITNSNGKKTLVDIRLGGSKSKIVIGTGTPASE